MPSKHQKWESLTKVSILNKNPWFKVLSESVRLPDGEVISEYYGIEMPHYASVFAVTEFQKIMVLFITWNWMEYFIKALKFLIKTAIKLV